MDAISGCVTTNNSHYSDFNKKNYLLISYVLVAGLHTIIYTNLIASHFFILV